MFMYGGLAVCSILVGLVISNDTLAAYFVFFLLRNKRIHFSFNVWMCGCVNVWIGNVPVEPSSKFPIHRKMFIKPSHYHTTSPHIHTFKEKGIHLFYNRKSTK